LQEGEVTAGDELIKISAGPEELISGEVTYEPEPLDPPPPATALICHARPTTNLTLDL
jgi:hypothetical protein